MEKFNLVKVFSATKHRERQALGEEITKWIKGLPNHDMIETKIVQSSDESFHCLSVIVFVRIPE